PIRSKNSTHIYLLPAQAGTHSPAARTLGTMDPGLRRDLGMGWSVPDSSRRRRVEGLDRRQRAVETLDLDQSKLAGRALCERRGAGIAGQHIRVAVDAKRRRGGWVFGVEPRPGRQLHDPGA